MKPRIAFLAALLTVAAVTASGQPTSFFYQGRLMAGGAPANGNFDFTFALFATNSGGTRVAGPLTNAAVDVSNGLFTVTLDFGNVFDGSSFWLETAVKTNGGSGFTTLTPRQPVRSTPYALYAPNAGTAAAAQAIAPGGTVPLGALPASVVTNGASDLNLTGAFRGDGGGLTNVAGPPETSGFATPVQMTNVAWGDSLTYAGYWEAMLQTAIGIPTLNEGVSGQGSGQILARFLAAPQYWGMNTIIWSGRNDAENLNDVLSNITAMVTNLTTTNWIVLSVINATNEGIGTVNYQLITNLNAHLQAAFTNHYLDVRKFLVNCADLSIPADYFSFTNDSPAAHLHWDNSVHLSPEGYEQVANCILESPFLSLSTTVPSLGRVLAQENQMFAAPPTIGYGRPGLAEFSEVFVGNNTNAILGLSGDQTALAINGSINSIVGGITPGTLSLGRETWPFASGYFAGVIEITNAWGKSIFYQPPSGGLQLTTGGPFYPSPGQDLGSRANPWGRVFASGIITGDGAGLTNLTAAATNDFSYVTAPPRVMTGSYYTNSYGRRVAWTLDVTNAAQGCVTAYVFSRFGHPIGGPTSVSLPDASGYHGSITLNLSPGDYFALTNVIGGPLEVRTNSIQEW